MISKQTILSIACSLFGMNLMAQRAITVDVDGQETNVGTKVFAMGTLTENEDGSAVAELFDVKKRHVATYTYSHFPDQLTRREYFHKGRTYLHLPLCEGDTLYINNRFMYGEKGMYPDFKGHYELWCPKISAHEYGVVTSVKEGHTHIRWYKMEGDTLLADLTYTLLYPNCGVKFDGENIRYYKENGNVRQRERYENDRKTSTEYYDLDGNLERKSVNGSLRGSYEMWQYYKPAPGEKEGRLKRHEVYPGKDFPTTGECYDEQGKQTKFIPYATSPKYKGGDEALGAKIKKNLKYPKEAIEAQIQGRVKLRFYVEEDGSLGDITVISTPHESLSNEAIRSLKASYEKGKMTPATREGKPMRSQYYVPVTFYLPKK